MAFMEPELDASTITRRLGFFKMLRGYILFTKSIIFSICTSDHHLPSLYQCEIDSVVKSAPDHPKLNKHGIQIASYPRHSEFSGAGYKAFFFLLFDCIPVRQVNRGTGDGFLLAFASRKSYDPQLVAVALNTLATVMPSSGAARP